MVLTTFFIEPWVLRSLKDAALHADLSVGQVMRKGAVMWFQDYVSALPRRERTKLLAKIRRQMNTEIRHWTAWVTGART